jgi:hypothetical protein
MHSLLFFVNSALTISATAQHHHPAQPSGRLPRLTPDLLAWVSDDALEPVTEAEQRSHREVPSPTTDIANAYSGGGNLVPAL